MVRLRDVCENVATEDPTKHNKTIDYIDISAIDAEAKEIVDYKTVLSAEAPSRARQKVYTGDVLVSTVRPNLNAVATIKAHENDIIASTGFCVLRAKRELALSRYIFEFTKTPKFVSALVSQATGASYPAVSNKIVLNERIPLPPLPTQQKIADILDRASALIEQRKTQIAKLELLVKSQFVEMFGDCEATRKRLKEICDFIDYRGKTPEKSETGIPLITAKNVKENAFSVEPQEFIPEANYETVMTRGIPQHNDVLFTTEAPLGNVCRIPPIYEKFCVGQRLITMQPKADILTSEYLERALLTQDFQEQVLRRSTGSTVMGIRSKELVELTVPIPSLDLQTRFADFAERVETQKARMREGLGLMETNYKALMQRCFEGEISSPSQLR